MEPPTQRPDNIMLNWRKHAFMLSLTGVALISACSGGYEIEVAAEPGEDTQDEVLGEESEYLVDEEGNVLGTTWQALSYPYCMNPGSDPDGDGWGWEWGRSCVVYRPPATMYPYCVSSASDPDGDGWGWENYRTCVVRTSYTGGSGGGTCANHEGVASTMAALAVSAAMELGRWQPTKDFTIGRIGYSEALVLTSTGKARCIDGCANTQALLDFQRDEANGQVTFPGGVTLNAPALRSRLVAKFRDQQACEQQPSNGGTTNCPVEDHTLTFQRSEKGGCDTKFYFVARKPDGSPLQYPAQLKNKLLWADRTNPYVGFESVGEVVSIDPTYGLNERGTTSNGACLAACVKIGLNDVSSDCCTCGGVTRTFRRSPWSSFTYLCK